ncbi:hypothetical protein BGZ47_003248 [Haplosporangium gracile]|nr:hypothetical protein BGZ47_003248 [Haplosporangium gracile]
METGGFHGQGFSAGSDPDDSSYHETSSTTTNNTITPTSSTRRYSVAGVIRSLFHAVLVQDTEHLDHVLSSLSLDPNRIRDKEHKTMLMVAATDNKHRVLRYLLTLPSTNVDLQDDEGETALYQAAAAGSTECAQLLLLAGASASLGNEEAITPLIIASYNGFLTICRLLISIGRANVNQQDNTQKSALLLASYAGHVDVMALLIEQGASLNILDQYGWSSLMLAAYAGKLDACKLLLAQGADPHIKTANGKNARSLSWDAGHKSIAVYITRHLSREGSSGGGGTSSIMSTTSGPGSSMSTRTLIQQMLPPVPRSPSRRTHSPAPSLPSVPEEAQEEDYYRPRRSFSGYNSTISRHSGLSSRLSAPPKARHHQSLPAVPFPPQPNDTVPSLPPLTIIGQDLSAIFIASKDDSPGSILEAGPVEEIAVPSNVQDQDDNVEEPTPTSPAVNEPTISEKSRPRIPWRPSTPVRIYSVHRRGLIPRYGTKHVHYCTESSLENADPIINRSGSNYHQRRVRLQKRSSNSLAERAKEKDMESDINRRIREHMQLIERNRNHIWVILSNLWTSCCPAKVLPKSWSADRQQDWREKVTLCSLITGLTILFGFLAFGLALLSCRSRSKEVFSTSEFAARYGNRSENPGRLATIRGAVYDIGSFFAEESHPSAASGGATSAAINLYLSAHYGDDMSALFPPPDLADTCRLFGATTNFGKCSFNSTAVNHCHSFSPSSVLRQFERSNVVITYPWSDIVDSTSRSLFVYDGSVFDATDYLTQVTGPTISPTEISRMYWIRGLIGRDATLAVQKQANYRDTARCFQAYFKVGELSGEPAGGCLASIVINTFSLAILLLITLMRLGSALVYRLVFPQPKTTVSGKGSSGPTTGVGSNKDNDSAASGDSIDTENHVLMLVTCQATDQDDQIRSTLDSLVLTDHDDGRKLLLVMADATWDDDGERSQASLACLRLMQPSMPIESEKHLLSSFSDNPFLEDIYSGYYVVDSRRVPYVLVLRTPDQDLVQEEYVAWWKKKLILRWLYRVCFNEPISSFEYALFERVRGLMDSGGGPDIFDMLLVAEVGIECDRRSLSRMVGTLRRNEKTMGVCAQRIISNATENWLTRVQDYENHLSLQFTSVFESTLSAVQCLPSRFSLVRIKLPCHQGCHYPGHVKFDKRNSDETSVFSDTDDDDEILAGVRGEERGDVELGEADGKVDVGAAEGHQHSTKRIKRQRLPKKLMVTEDIQYSIPILVHPDVISCFVGNKARTLHERSLLLQGAEDRYLTGLLHQTFPDRRIVYVPQAIYRSTVTPYLRSFLQEQGRLLASSFHTLWRQIWILQLRGRFCSSLNFLVLVEWLALVILPSAVVFSMVLLVMVTVGAVEKVGALDALPVVLALCFMMVIVALQPLLGICLEGGERTFARNLYGAALFLVVLPFKSLAMALYACFYSTGKVKHYHH